MKVSSLLYSLTLGTVATAQSFVAPPTNVERVLSEKFPGASISYKQVHNLCETTEGVRSFSGYVHLPQSLIPDATEWREDMSANFFFWYFEARNDPESAPTAIYLGGGPGYTSFDGSSVFPCYVNSDSNSTTLNEHSWNKNVNMLYIDQPLGTGFSYTNIANGTLDLVSRNFTLAASGDEVPESSLTMLPATIQPSDLSTITNTTMSAARSLWRFAQVWFNEFPEISTDNDEISIWAVSYGGLYAPVFTSYFIDQNAIIQDDEHELANATVLSMATVGLINAMVDIRSMALNFPEFAINNTYGLQVYPEEVVEQVITNITAPEVGCYALVDRCRAAVEEGDPESTGANPEVNELCVGALQVCFSAATVVFDQLSPNFHFDITFNKPGSAPTEYEVALFNQPWVQAELGVPLNYTSGNNDVETAFLGGTGDAVRYGLEHLAHVIDNGVNVAMVYGDRDFRCNWYSAENASLNIPFPDADNFAAAGYEPIVTNSTYEGGLVREYGNLSFSRVFQAGHSTGGYQPETLSVIFDRAMSGHNVATGDVSLLDANEAYRTVGPLNVRNITNELPDPIENICYVLQPAYTCTEEQLEALLDGSAEVHNWVVVDPAGSKGHRLGETDGDENSGSGGSGESEGGGDDTSAGLKNGISLVAVTLPIAILALF